MVVNFCKNPYFRSCAFGIITLHIFSEFAFASFGNGNHGNPICENQAPKPLNPIEKLIALALCQARADTCFAEADAKYDKCTASADANYDLCIEMGYSPHLCSDLHWQQQSPCNDAMTNEYITCNDAKDACDQAVENNCQQPNPPAPPNPPQFPPIPPKPPNGGGDVV